MEHFNLFSFVFLIQMVLVSLKLLGVFNHLWIIIFLPSIIYLSLVFLILLILGISVVIIASLNSNKK